MISQIKVRAKSQSTWHLYKQSLYKCYYVYDDDIKFKTQTESTEAQEDETLVFQKNMYKIQNYINPFEQNNDHARLMHKIQYLSSLHIKSINT